MRIRELLDPRAVEIGIQLENKSQALEHMSRLMEKSGNITNREAYKKEILAREAESTTGIGEGIAIPHARCSAVKAPGLAAAVVKNGVPFDSLDGKDVNLIFMIAVPEGAGSMHLEALAKLSAMLMDEEFRKTLLNTKSASEFIAAVDAKETELDLINEQKEKRAASANETGYDVLCITACPTGIAHTFMAAESLETRGKAKNLKVKVETQGADGAKNVLSSAEIANAKCIIIAADKKVSLERFDGKPLIQAKVADGIHKADQLLDQAMNGNAGIYHHNGSVSEESNEEKEGIGRSIYKNLMNGVSHMLPFVIGGGILIALAFLFDDFSIDPANFGKNTPLAAYLKTIGEFAFGMMLPVLSGYIAMSIADRPGLAVGFVAGLVAKAGSTFANPAGGDVNAGFLGALFAGFVAGYVILGLKKLTERIPASINSIRPMIIYPVAGILTACVLTTLINPFMGMINDALNGFLNSLSGSSKVLLGMVVAGMQSVDMGGPVNKTSYVFATSQLAEGNYEIMAAVMAGGMIPPLAIALCTTLFKNRFTRKERESGLVNYLLGLSFISEGAIPFAASDPLRILPSCIVGSAIAGGLSMFFGCTLMAPHGGIFVLPTVGNPFMYILSIFIGALAGCLILAVLKKPLKKEAEENVRKEKAALSME